MGKVLDGDITFLPRYHNGNTGLGVGRVWCQTFAKPGHEQSGNLGQITLDFTSHFCKDSAGEQFGQDT